MKITKKQVEKLLQKTDLDEMTPHELRIILRAVANEIRTRGIGMDLKAIVEANKRYIITD